MMPSRASSRPASYAQSDRSEEQPTYPILDEQFLPRIVAIFYSIFHPTEGAKVVYQVPEEVISTRNAEQNEDENTHKLGESSSRYPKYGAEKTPIFDFRSISDFIIPKAPLCGRLISYSIVSSAGQTYKILSHPVILLDQAKYPRKSFIFNLAFVFDGRADTRAYEPIVRKCARELRDLEVSSSFLSKSQSRMYVVIEQLFEDLNSYCESFVALPEAPHSEFHKEIPQGPFSFSKQSIGSDIGSDIGSPLNNNSGFKIPEGSTNADKTWSTLSVAGESLRKAIEQVEAAAPTTIGEANSSSNDFTRPPARRASTDHEGSTSSVTMTPLGFEDIVSARKGSAGSLIGDRPGVGRAKTVAALGISETTVNAVVSGNGTKSEGDPGIDDGGSPALGRNGSVGSTSSKPVDELQQSILSLRAIDASGDEMQRSSSNSKGVHRVGESVGAVPPAPMLAPGKREPPHGLGRTVRDAINLKLFPTYPNPAEVNDWDVPVTLLDLKKRMTGNWDLTICRVLPFIDGVNHVKRIAQLADADIELTRQCIEHLLYYRCIIMTDIFQFTNMYTVRPSIATIAEDELIMSECASYVTKPDYRQLSCPRLLYLYSTLRPAITVNDWIEVNDVDGIGIDVRRFVSFGVIKGFLRRVHRYPVLIEDAPVVTQNDSDTTRDESSNSRSRERKQGHATQAQLSPQTSTFVDTGSPVRGRNIRLRHPSENDSLREGGTATSVKSISSVGRRRYGESIQSHRKVRATVVDAANVALEAAALAKEQDRQAAMSQPVPSNRISIRAPLPRGSSSSTIRGVQSRDVTSQSQAEEYLASRRGSKISSIQIPPELIAMLDGTHPDDEFCVKFGHSWNEILDILFLIGKQGNTATFPPRSSVSGPSLSSGRRTKIGDRDEEGMVTPVEVDETTTAGWSGFYGTTIGSRRKSVGSSLPKYRSSQSNFTSSGAQSGFSRYTSMGESGWGRMSGLQNIIPEEVPRADRENLARGDLGRVKIIIK